MSVGDQRLFFSPAMEDGEARKGKEMVEVRVCFDYYDAVGWWEEGKEGLSKAHAYVGAAYYGDCGSVLADAHVEFALRG